MARGVLLPNALTQRCRCKWVLGDQTVGTHSEDKTVLNPPFDFGGT
jgi:hypothetical protein